MNLFQPDLPDGIQIPNTSDFRCRMLRPESKDEMAREAMSDGFGTHFRIEMPDGELDYFPHFMAPEAGSATIENLLAMESGNWRDLDWQAEQPQDQAWISAAWQHVPIRMFGKEVMQPRFTAWHGDPDAAYTYSGRLHVPAPWNPVLQRLRGRLEQAVGQRFNAVLLNWYRNGQDSMGWHCDDEPELGAEPVIASLSLGAERRFLLRMKSDPACKVTATLGHGSLLVMRGTTQRYWQHAVPKTKKVMGHRLNLTFRAIKAGNAL